MNDLEHPSAGRAALAAFNPANWGCESVANGWQTTLPGIGAVGIARLGWPAAQCPSFLRSANGETSAMDSLEFLGRLQGEVWGMPPAEWTPPHVLAVLPDTGGSVLAAYALDTGWNSDGWLGFSIAAGSRDGVLVSHMLGVRQDVRGGGGIGWLLKVLQGYDALCTGHHAAIWTFDPMRGANARLNIEKLGATVDVLTIDKYGPLRSSLYGDVPSDRFTAHWDLYAPETHARLMAVHERRYRGPSADLVHRALSAEQGLDPVEPDATYRYDIPADIDLLSREDPESANAWRTTMRQVLGRLMDTKSAEASAGDPLTVGVYSTTGTHQVTGFDSSINASGERANSYLLIPRNPAESPIERKEQPS